MDISALLNNSPNLMGTGMQELPALNGTPRAIKTTQVEKGFESRMQELLTETNSSQIQADESVRAMAAGEEVDLHGTMIALEKAGLTMKLTVAVRNKALEAYHEIMRMQV